MNGRASASRLLRVDDHHSSPEERRTPLTEQRPSSRVAEIIRAVTQNVLEGRLSLQIASRFQRATRAGLLPQKRWLYEGIGTACWRDTLLALSRLVERHREGVTLRYLLDYSEQNPGEYPLASAEILRQEVVRQRARLTSSPL